MRTNRPTPSRSTGAASAGLAALSLLAGCVSVERVPFDPENARESSPSAFQPIDIFAVPDEAPPIVNQDRDDLATRHHEVIHLSFPASGPNGQPDDRVDAYWYRSRAAGPRPVIVVLPIWGASTYPPRVITRGIVRRYGGEVDVIRMLGEERIFDWDRLNAAPDEESFARLIDEMAERMRVQVVDTRRLVRWAASRPETDPGRVALVGFSIGAMVGALVLASEPEIDRAVLAMGGANLGEVIAYCRGLRTELRQIITPRLGWSLSQYQAFMSEAFADLNPARYPGRIDPSAVLMIDAKYDDCMPESSREALWETLGRPERITYRYNHRRAFYAMTPLGLNTMRRKIYRFLDGLFAGEPLATAPLPIGEHVAARIVP